MKLLFLTVGKGAERRTAFVENTSDFLGRCKKALPAEWISPKTSGEVFKLRDRPASHLILLDSRGKQMSSEEFADLLRSLRDGGKREVALAIGPADGWTDEERKKADTLLSLGKMTLPHELAALVLAEQIWRACAILTNHPYHSGHND